MINHRLYYPFMLSLVLLHTAGLAQQISFDDQVQLYPGSAASCVVGKTLQRNENTWLSISKCSNSRIAVTQYSHSENQGTLIVDNEFGLEGVVTFDSIAGITTNSEFTAPQIDMLSRNLKFTDAKLNPKGELLIAGFNYDLVESDDAPLLYTNMQPWWLLLDSKGIPVLSTTGQYLHWQPNPFETFGNYGGGDWFHGLRANAFVLPIQDGSVITGSVHDLTTNSAYADHYGNVIRIEKYLNNGQPDTEFGQNGTLEIFPAASEQLINNANIAGMFHYDESHFLLIINDFINYRYGGFSLLKISYDGIVQAEFGQNGRFEIPDLLETSQFANSDINGIIWASASDLVIEENWIYLSWQERNKQKYGNITNVVARLNLNGKLDTTFADEGLYKWPPSFIDNSVEPGQVEAGNPYISVLDGQIALLNSDARIFTDQESSLFALLQLLTHNGQLNKNFSIEGSLAEAGKGITDAFSFSGNHNFTPPFNMNKAMHLFTPKRQLVIPFIREHQNDTTLSVINIFDNKPPMQINPTLIYTDAGEGLQIDTRIVDPDADELHVVLVHAPDYVSLDGLSSNNSVQLYAEIVVNEPTPVNVTLSVSDGINSPYLVTLSIFIPLKEQISVHNTVSAGSLNFWLGSLCIAAFIIRRKFY